MHLIECHTRHSQHNVISDGGHYQKFPRSPNKLRFLTILSLFHTDHEHPSESGSATKNDVTMFVTLDEAYNISIDGALHSFISKLQEILKIPAGTELKQCCSEPGSTKLTFQLPCCVVQNVFPLSKEQETDLSSNDVSNLWFIYQFNRQVKMIFLCITL